MRERGACAEDELEGFRAFERAEVEGAWCPWIGPGCNQGAEVSEALVHPGLTFAHSTERGELRTKGDLWSDLTIDAGVCAWGAS